jgi:hypothetical protein
MTALVREGALPISFRGAIDDRHGTGRERTARRQRTERAMTGPGGSSDIDPAEAERRRVADEIATRLRQRGLRLIGDESGEELVNLLEAVERFERAVERAGGDLMMDEAVSVGAPIQPDDRGLALPERQDNDSAADFIARINSASEQAGRKRR